MAKMKKALLAVFLLVGHYQSAQQAPSGSIEGYVVVLGSSRPLAGVAVFLAGPPSNRPAPPIRSYTDANGRFLFQNVPAPRTNYYRVGAEAAGFEGVPEEVPFTAGQVVRDIVVTMMTGGTIRGRITDDRNVPIAGITVFVYRVEHDPIDSAAFISPYRVTVGHPGYLRSVNRIGTNADIGTVRQIREGNDVAGGANEAFVQTDNAGNYALQGIPAAQYIIGVEFPSVYTPSLNGFATTFYPGVTDSTKARLIDVEPEGSISGINFVVQRPVRFQVSGVIRNFNSPGLLVATLHLPGVDRKMAPAWSGSVNPDGKFEIRHVFPGVYELTAIEGTNLVTIPLEVKSNVSGLLLRMPTATTVSGKLSVVLRKGDAQLPGPVKLALEPPGSASGIQILDEGTFVMTGVAPGKRYMYQMFAPSGYVLDVHQGDHDVRGDHLIEVGNTTEPLKVLVHPADFGTIQGAVKAEVGATRVARLLLVPRGLHRANAANYYDVRTKSDGTFRLSNVLPGEYTLIAWEFGRALGLDPYVSSVVLAKFERYGTKIVVPPNGNVTIVAPLVPH